MVLWLAFAVGGCATNFATDSRYRNEGPGNQLYSIETPVATENLRKYFVELARQADLPTTQNTGAGEEVIVLPATNWDILVRTGMNDIDLRCDNYLTWIDQKRTERILVNETITAISTLAAGVLGLAAPETSALSYVALGLGFVGTVYNSYQNSILMGLESSTIKTIVHERRLTLRAEWRQVSFTNKPDAVYALRSYLRICTPQAITMDVNTYSRYGITGRGTPLRAEIQQQAEAMGLNPRQSVITPPIRGDVESPLAYDKVFVLTPGWNPQEKELGKLLKAICYDERSAGPVFGADGRPGRRMATSIAIAEAEYYSKRPDDRRRDGKIDQVEYDQLVLQTKDCANIRAQNYHEAKQYHLPLQVDGLIDKINRISRACIPKDATLVVGSPLRVRIKQLRAEHTNALSEDKNLSGVDEQLTVALTREINRLSAKSETDCK